VKVEVIKNGETPESLIRDFRLQVAQHCKNLRNISWDEVRLPDADLDEEICILEELLRDLEGIGE
jgi:hypothetical protein